MRLNSTNASKAKANIFLLIITEWFLPLCIALLALPFAITIVGGFVVVVLLPVLLAALIRAQPVKEKKLDLYVVSIVALAFFAFIYWSLSIVSVVVLSALFYLFVIIKKNEAFSGILFIALGFFCSLITSLSGAIPFGGRLATLLLILAFSTIVGLMLYVLIIGRERFLARPTIALTVAMLPLIFSAFTLYQTGGRTGWLTGLVAKQKGVELIYKPTASYLSPRAVVSTSEGLLMYNNMDELSILRDGELDVISSKVFFGRAISFVCDPDDKNICYIPANQKGVAIVNIATGQTTKTDFPPADYSIIISSADMKYLAVMEDAGAIGSTGLIVIAKREAPGKLSKVAELHTKLINTNIIFSNLLTFIGSNVLFTTKTKGKKILGFSFNVETQNLYKFLEVKDYSGGHFWWHSAIIEQKYIVFPLSNGRILIYDIENSFLRSSKFTIPFTRYVLYDQQRWLCYIVSDLGFLIIFDPYRAKTIRKIFLGFKTKSAYQEGDYIYIGSTAGIFRIDIDRALRN